MAHSRLATNDLLLTLLIFATVYQFWSYHAAPSFKGLLLTGVLFGLALLSKFSAIVLLPILGILALLAPPRCACGKRFFAPCCRHERAHIGAQSRDLPWRSLLRHQCGGDAPLDLLRSQLEASPSRFPARDRSLPSRPTRDYRSPRVSSGRLFDRWLVVLFSHRLCGKNSYRVVNFYLCCPGTREFQEEQGGIFSLGSGGSPVLRRAGKPSQYRTAAPAARLSLPHRSCQQYCHGPVQQATIFCSRFLLGWHCGIFFRR